MLSLVLLRYLHFISIFAVVASLVAEHLLYKPQLSHREIRRISILDSIYGLGSIGFLATGLTMWLGAFAKSPEYYSMNWIFLTKLSLAILLGILSIYPTIFFFKNRKGQDEEALVDMPKSILLLIRIELGIVFLIPLLASLMANGFGYMG